MEGQRGLSLAFAFGSALLFCNVGSTIVIQYTKNPDGSFDYDKISVVVVTELAKLFISTILFTKAVVYPGKDGPPTTKFNLDLFMRMSVPGLCYALSNVLTYSAVQLLGSTLFQLFNNMKIVLTAILFRMIIKRSLTVLQWGCMVLLALSMCIASDSGCPSIDNLPTSTKPSSTGSSYDNTVAVDQEKKDGHLMYGFVIMVTISITASLAGVYNEFLLKNNKEHPMMQNMMLYTWTVIFCFWQYSDTYQRISGEDKLNRNVDINDVFRGFTPAVWISIFLHAIYGQIVSLTFLYCDNIVKVYANSVAVIVSAGMEYVMFDTALSANMVMGGMITAISTYVYYSDPKMLLRSDTSIFGAPKESTNV
eukprot:m.71811 g.71811  ORF g.71811 m.71811 type:complete len:365 (-) comp16097_c0_seq1:544-1638(-)